MTVSRLVVSTSSSSSRMPLWKRRLQEGSDLKRSFDIYIPKDSTKILASCSEQDEEDEVTCTFPSSSEKDAQDEHLILRSTNPISLSSSVVNSSLTNSCSDAGFSNGSTDYEHYAAPKDAFKFSKSSSTTQAATEERTLIQKTKGKKKPPEVRKREG